MNEAHYSIILAMKVAGLIEVWMKSTGMSLEDSLHAFYCSEVYRVLEREETKLWYHSPLLLLDCFKSEVETGKPEFPDE